MEAAIGRTCILSAVNRRYTLLRKFQSSGTEYCYDTRELMMASLDLSSVAVLNQNSVYRFKDIVNCSGATGRWKKDRLTILKDPLYKNTILRKYLESLVSNDHDSSLRDFNLLREIIITHALDNKYERPARDSATFHLRLGDICDIPGKYKSLLGGTERALAHIFSLGDDVTTINLVTALHFGCNDDSGLYFPTSSAKERSYRLLGSIVDRIESSKKKLKLVSSHDIDFDICFMARSPILIPSGGSGLPRLISHIMNLGRISFRQV